MDTDRVMDHPDCKHVGSCNRYRLCTHYLVFCLVCCKVMRLRQHCWLPYDLLGVWGVGGGGRIARRAHPKVQPKDM